MRTKTNQLAIVAFSFAFSDLLATGPIDHIRWGSLCRGKRRLASVRAFGRRVQAVIDRAGLALWAVYAKSRAKVASGCGHLTSKAKAGCQHVTGRLTQVWERVSQVGRVICMFAGTYGLLLGMSRGGNIVLPQEGKPVQPTKPATAPENMPAMPSLPMSSAARVTTETEPKDKADLIERAKALIAQGKSQRAAAKEVGLKESTLRSRLKRENS